jgi:hypothetical protein
MKIVPGAFGQAHNLRWNEVKALLLTEQFASANYWDYKVRADRHFEDGNFEKGLETLKVAESYRDWVKELETQTMCASYGEDSDYVGTIGLD